MSAVETLAHLLTEYEAAKREHLEAWAAVHGDLLAADARSWRPPGVQELQRLAVAQMRRRVVEAQLAERMEVELDAPPVLKSQAASSPPSEQAEAEALPWPEQGTALTSVASP